MPLLWPDLLTLGPFGVSAGSFLLFFPDQTPLNRALTVSLQGQFCCARTSPLAPTRGGEIIMAITPELEAQILRLHYVEKWRVGTIARQLGVHHGTVDRVL